MSTSQYEFNRNFAVIIGINKYQNHNNDIRPLETARPDAEEFARVLREEYNHERYEIQLLLDETATLEQLNRLIEHFKHKQIIVDSKKLDITENDRLLFYFAGHGIAKDGLDTQDGPVGYLIPQDATKDEETWLLMQDLHNALIELPCRHLLVILDCCFAGAFRWSCLNREWESDVKVYKERYDHYISHPAWQVITSTADDQKAIDSFGKRGKIAKGNHSPFAQALFDALCGTNHQKNDKENKKTVAHWDDGIITVTDLYSFLRKRVEPSTEEKFQRQTPSLCQLRKHSKGEFIFRLPSFDRNKLENAPSLTPDNNPYRGLQSYDEEDNQLFFGRDKLIEQLFHKIVSGESKNDDQQNIINPQPLTIILGVSGAGKSSLMKAGLLHRLRNSQEYKLQVLDPMRPGKKPFESLARICLPSVDENHAKTILNIKKMSQELKQDSYKIINFLKKYTQNKESINDILQLIEGLKFTNDMLDFDHSRFSEEDQKNFKGIWSYYSNEEKNLSEQWINKFNERKDLYNSLKKPIEDLTKELENPHALRNIIQSWINNSSNTKLIVPIDQFEELITLCQTEKERNLFQEQIKEAISKFPNHIHIVITLRLDFEAYFQKHILKDFWNDHTRFLVSPMTQDEIREVIEKPAIEKVLYFEPHSLVNDLTNAVVQMPGALPLLSFTLSELYLNYLNDRTRDKRALTKEDYEALGGVFGAITNRANQEYEQLLEEDKNYQDTVRRVMLRMISLQGGELARRQVPKWELNYPDEAENNRVQTVIKRFSEARLIVEGSNSQGETYVEPAHDALVQGWDKLSIWRTEYEQSISLQRELTPAAEKWKRVKSQEQISNLLAKVKTVTFWLDCKLSTVESFLDKISIIIKLPVLLLNNKNQETHLRNSVLFLWNTNPYLDFLAKTLNESRPRNKNKFINNLIQKISQHQNKNKLINDLIQKISQQSIQKHDNWLNELEAKFVCASILKKRQDHRWRIRLAIVTISFLSVLTIAALIGQRNALIEQVISSQQASEANLRSNQDFDALIASLRAGKTLKHSRLLQIFQYLPTLSINNQLQDQVQETLQKSVHSVKEINRLKHSKEASNTTVRFSPNGQLFATAGDDGTIVLWNSEGKRLKNLPEEQDQIWSIDFSPDSQLLASAGQRGIVRLWNLQHSKSNTWNASIGWIRSISFSKDGRLLATAGEKGTIIWNLQNRSSVKLEGQTGVWSVSFSPDGQLVATTGLDRTVRLWDLKGKLVKQRGGYQNSLRSVNFSPDSQFVAIAGDWDSVGLWEWQTDQYIDLKQTQVWSVSFSPLDGQSLVTAGFDGAIRFLDRQGNEKKILRSSDFFSNFSFNLNGSLLATAGDNGNIALWNVQDQQSPKQTKYVEKNTPSTHDSCDLKNKGLRVKIGEQGTMDGDKAFVFNSQNQYLAETSKGHPNGVNSISCTIDGNLLATAGGDGKVRLWDLQNLPSTGEKRKLVLKQEWSAEKNWLSFVQFSPDSKQLATGSYGSVRLWNINSKPLASWKTDRGLIKNISFSSDGKRLTIIGEWGNPQILPIETFDELMEKGCNWVTNYLRNGSEVNHDDRHLCDGISKPKKPV